MLVMEFESIKEEKLLASLFRLLLKYSFWTDDCAAN